MKRVISNPNKVQYKIYIWIIGISLATLLLSLVIPTYDSVVWTTVLDVVKNLSYGCIASTVVALLIDCANVKKENKKANDTYDAIYVDLKVQIAWFVGAWAEMCAASFKEKDYYSEKHSWSKWYEITKNNYESSDTDTQNRLLSNFRNALLERGKSVLGSIDKITSQTYMLTINDAMNTKLRSIISDFKFEFEALCGSLSVEKYERNFWDHTEAVTGDLINYIAAWTDISFYNTIEFRPYYFLDVAKYEFARKE